MLFEMSYWSYFLLTDTVHTTVCWNVYVCPRMGVLGISHYS